MSMSGMFVTVLVRAVLARRDSEYPPEPSAEMALVGKSGLRSNRGNGLTSAEQLACLIEPACEPEGVRWHTATPGKHAGKALTAHSHSRRDLPHGLIASAANGRAETRRHLILPMFADYGNEVVPLNLI